MYQKLNKIARGLHTIQHSTVGAKQASEFSTTQHSTTHFGTVQLYSTVNTAVPQLHRSKSMLSCSAKLPNLQLLQRVNVRRTSLHEMQRVSSYPQVEYLRCSGSILFDWAPERLSTVAVMSSCAACYTAQSAGQFTLPTPNPFISKCLPRYLPNCRLQGVILTAMDNCRW